MVLLHAQGKVGIGETSRARSIIGSEFVCGITSKTTVGDRSGIVPTVSGRAWITETKHLLLDPSDPWQEGYRLSDT
jgi:proline racemase